MTLDRGGNCGHLGKIYNRAFQFNDNGLIGGKELIDLVYAQEVARLEKLKKKLRLKEMPDGTFRITAKKAKWILENLFGERGE